MQKALEKEIINKYPNLYRGKNLPPSKCWINRGLQHGDGWKDLLDEASSEVENLIKLMPKKDRKDTFAMHVVSKNGCLRVYMSTIQTDIENILNKLVTKSLKTCEVCGEEGYRKNDITRCGEHHDEYFRKRLK